MFDDGASTPKADAPSARTQGGGSSDGACRPLCGGGRKPGGQHPPSEARGGAERGGRRRHCPDPREGGDPGDEDEQREGSSPTPLGDTPVTSERQGRKLLDRLPGASSQSSSILSALNLEGGRTSRPTASSSAQGGRDEPSAASASKGAPADKVSDGRGVGQPAPEREQRGNAGR